MIINEPKDKELFRLMARQERGLQKSRHNACSQIRSKTLDILSISWEIEGSLKGV